MSSIANRTVSRVISPRVLVVDTGNVADTPEQLADLPCQIQRAVVQGLTPALASKFDVVAIDLDNPEGAALFEALAERHDRPILIALAGRGHGDVRLEVRLTLAELHGAAISLPKPAEIDEIVRAGLDALAKAGAITGSRPASRGRA